MHRSLTWPWRHDLCSASAMELAQKTKQTGRGVVRQGKARMARLSGESREVRSLGWWRHRSVAWLAAPPTRHSIPIDSHRRSVPRGLAFFVSAKEKPAMERLGGGWVMRKLFSFYLSTLILIIVGVASPAQAAAPQVSLTVSVSGGGTVTSDLPGIDCSEDISPCFSNFKKSTHVTLTAVPDSGIIFEQWSGHCVGDQPTCRIRLREAASVTALFSIPTVSYPAPVQTTGQVSCWDLAGYPVDCQGTGQDGETKTGVPAPNPRFVDNGDGTVLDNLTGLVWLRNADCIASNYPAISADGSVNWQMALDFIAGMNDGAYYCGTDKIDWRLPNVRELLSLGDYELGVGFGPALPTGHPFQNARFTYWTSTNLINPQPKRQAFFVDNFLIARFAFKTDLLWVLAVRGGK